MAYFYRDEAYRHRNSPRRHGRLTKPVQLDPIAIAPQKTRDDVMTDQIANMQDTIGTEDFLMKKIAASDAKATGRRPPPNTSRVNNVFPEGRIDTPPNLRLRPRPTDEMMAKLWAPDNHKEEVAQRMAENPTLVDKMLDSKFPMPHPPSPTHARKKASTLPRAPNDTNEPAGFRGMGNFSEAQKPRGPRSKPTEYELPELKLKARTKGRKRGNVPEDQWSFNSAAPNA